MECKKRAAFFTLGCKVNQYETQAILELFSEAGYQIVPFEEVADVYVINTCTVTQMSDKKSRQMIARAHARNEDACIVVTGCYAQRAPENILNLPGVKLVIGTKDRMQIVSQVEQVLEEQAARNYVNSIKHEHVFEPLSAIRDGKTRAHLKIQDGCNRYCSYCIIPYTRGPIRSRPLEQIREEMQKLADEGFVEIVLTGIHLMSYGKDMPGNVTLLDAIAQADDIDAISRIRLGSLEPVEVNDAFVEAIAGNRKICRQFHLSLQSGSASVLQRMNRRYSPQDYEQSVQRLRTAMPGCAITTDIIAGFVGETEQEFEETLEFVKRIGFARIHVFPYSKRDGTRAADMPGHLPKSVKEERAHALITLGNQLEQSYLNSAVGTTQQVLIEEEIDGYPEGYTDTYIRTRIKNIAPDTKGLIHVIIREIDGTTAVAEPL